MTDEERREICNSRCRYCGGKPYVNNPLVRCTDGQYKHKDVCPSMPATVTVTDVGTLDMELPENFKANILQAADYIEMLSNPYINFGEEPLSYAQAGYLGRKIAYALRRAVQNLKPESE